MINDKEYWNKRFISGDWDANNGKEQTLFHYKVLLDHIPDWLKKEISYDKMSICDLGCGMGEGVNLIKEYFKDSEVTGVDFSNSAIQKAEEQKVFDVNFVCSDMRDFSEHFDIILSSHTLEHFEKPFEMFCHSIKLASKYFILLIPFQENDLYKEHFHSFNYNFFPINVNDYELVHYKEIDKLFFNAGGYLAQEQLLVVYVNKKNIDINKFSLENLNNNYYEDLKLFKKNYEKNVSKYDKFYKISNDELKDLKNNIEKLNYDIMMLNYNNEKLKCDNEKLKYGNSKLELKNLKLIKQNSYLKIITESYQNRKIVRFIDKLKKFF